MAILDNLYQLQDIRYRDFQSKLIPTVPPAQFIGVRTPALRALARQFGKTPEAAAFLSVLPHQYFDENQLHAFIISEIKDFSKCIDEVCRFLPYIDNWATCDQMSPKVFKKHRMELLPHIREWLGSAHPFTVRFAIGMLMQHFLDDAFDPSYLMLVSAIRSEEYYVNMMIAWYFATALAKQYEATLPFIENRKLDPWTHNKAIQKALESYRIDAEKKVYMKSLKY